jgi:signal peptidase II
MSTEAIPFPVRRTRDWRLPLLVLSAVVVLVDRLTKIWVVKHVLPGSAIVVIPKVFRITHVLNSGAAFSLFADTMSPGVVRKALIAFSVIAVLVVLAMLWKLGRRLSVTSLSLALILGGAIGNMYDRARLFYVVDFLEVHIARYHWPDFNVADSCIVIGACLLLLEIFRGGKVE